MSPKFPKNLSGNFSLLAAQQQRFQLYQLAADHYFSGSLPGQKAYKSNYRWQAKPLQKLQYFSEYQQLQFTCQELHTCRLTAQTDLYLEKKSANSKSFSFLLIWGILTSHGLNNENIRRPLYIAAAKGQQIALSLETNLCSLDVVVNLETDKRINTFPVKKQNECIIFLRREHAMYPSYYSVP